MTTNTREKLAAEAEAAGLIVERSRTRIRIRKSPKGVGVDIWEDGVATRCDVSLELAIAIRTAKAVRQLLGLPLK
jgi:hypothetical protein